MTDSNYDPIPNKRRRPHCLLAAVAIVLASIGSAAAFPTWIGVYGDTQHQTGGNPGVFTILASDDYWGLHASLGVQINGGPFQEYLMTYSGRKDSNSLWTISPGAFPSGANVKYYFHVWDNSGGSIWDNNGGSNYTLTAGAPTPWVVPGDLSIGGSARLLPRGDLSMGSFTYGPLP